MSGINRSRQKTSIAILTKPTNDFHNKIGTSRTWRDVRLESVMRTKADIDKRTLFLGFARQAGQQVDVPHCLDGLLCARTVSMIAILLTARRTATGSVHPTDTTAVNRGRTAAFPCSFRFGCAPGRVVGALHGVDAHFVFAPPPIPAGSGNPVSSRMGIGAPELVARTAGETARPPPVVTLSAIIA